MITCRIHGSFLTPASPTYIQIISAFQLPDTTPAQAVISTPLLTTTTGVVSSVRGCRFTPARHCTCAADPSPLRRAVPPARGASFFTRRGTVCGGRSNATHTLVIENGFTAICHPLSPGLQAGGAIRKATDCTSLNCWVAARTSFLPPWRIPLNWLSSSVAARVLF